jgi:hypothetical protein
MVTLMYQLYFLNFQTKKQDARTSKYGHKGFMKERKGDKEHKKKY